MAPKLLSGAAMKIDHALALACLCVLAACGDDDPAGAGGGDATAGSGGAGATIGSTGGAGGGGGEAPPAPETSTLGAFSTGPSLATRRDHHVTFVIDRGEGARFLHVQGGATDMQSIASTTERAPILEDGSLGPFEAVGPSIGVVGHGVAVRGDRVLLFGGQRAGGVEPRSQVIPVAADGSLGEPEEGPSMHSGRFHVGGAQVGDVVYAVGGLEDVGGAPWSTETVEIARFDDEGVGPWTETTSLPGPRSHHVVAAHGGFLYVAGGLNRVGNFTDDTSLPDVIRAPIADDGALGAWETIATLPFDLAVGAATVRGDQLWLVGGLAGSHVHGQPTGGFDEFMPHVHVATITPEGLGPFELAGELPEGRGHCHQVPVVGDVLYTVGGHGNDGRSQDAAYFARFTPAE